jgi:cysteine desulfurase
MRVYLDNAATTQIDKEVLEAMLPMLQEQFGNPSSIHSHGRQVRATIEQARKTISKLLNASPSEIFFTSGGTEADNMAIRCCVEDLGLTHAITSPIEHHAVIYTLQELEKKGKIKLSILRLTTLGQVDMEHLEELLKNSPRSLVSLMHANNEIGNMIDLDEVSELCKRYNAVFHSDTVQTMGHYNIDLQKTKIHSLSCAAHKFNGPKGVGFIYINSELKIKPMITGGSQERNMRGGTENVYGIVGLAKALEVACRDMKEHRSHIEELRKYMIEQLKEHIPGVEFNGDYDGRCLYTVLNVSFPPCSVSDMMLFKLDIAGISASGGSACSSGSSQGSHVLTALGTDPERPAVRFSFGKYNTKEELDYVVEKLAELYVVAK